MTESGHEEWKYEVLKLVSYITVHNEEIRFVPSTQQTTTRRLPCVEFNAPCVLLPLIIIPNLP